MTEKKPNADGSKGSVKGTEYLEGSLISENPVKILMVDIGGGGTATVARLTQDIASSRLYSSGEHNNLTIALLNTDKQALDGYYRGGGETLAEYVPEENVIQLGKSGLGGGAYPEVGASFMDEAIRDGKLDKILQSNYDLAILVGTFGKATGTGGLPVLSKYLIDNKKVTTPLAVVTFPFECEGDLAYENAVNGYNSLLRLEQLKLLTLYNDNLDKMASMRHSGSIEDLSLGDAFKLVDGVLADGVRTVVDIVMRVGNPNADFNDVKRVLEYGREFSFICASASGENRLDNIVNQIKTASLDGGRTLLTQKAKGILAAFYAENGQASMTLAEYKKILKTLKEASIAGADGGADRNNGADRKANNVKIIYAAFPKEFGDDEKDRLDVSLILAGGDAAESSAEKPDETATAVEYLPLTLRDAPAGGSTSPHDEGKINIDLSNLRLDSTHSTRP